MTIAGNAVEPALDAGDLLLSALTVALHGASSDTLVDNSSRQFHIS